MKKTLFIIAGANGSGKTTFALNFAQLDNLKFINADEIAKQYDPNDIQRFKVKAGKKFFEELDISLNDTNSFVIETTLSGKYLVSIIKKAKEKKFHINLIYLFLETNNENILRVKNRVLNGGHNVPTQDIIRRYYRSRELFTNTYSKIVDEWTLFYNGNDNFQMVENQNELFDEDLKELFLKGMKND